MTVLRDVISSERFPPKGFTDDNLIKRTVITLTADQLRAIATTPVLAISLNSANGFIYLVADPIYKLYEETIPFSSSNYVHIKPYGATYNLATLVNALTLSGGDVMGIGELYKNSVQPEGDDIYITGAADWTGATADGYLKIELLYREIEL